MAGGGKFFVSVTPHGHEAVVDRLQQAGIDTAKIFRESQAQIQAVLRDILTQIFIKYASEEIESFPPIYLFGIFRVLSELPIQLERTSAYTFSVGFNFGELGTREELSQGYHYGASLASGGQVTLPYHSAALKNDVELRYQFWRALRYKITHNGRLLDDHLWEETLLARTSYWNSIGKAPQWLLLQYGQQDWAPTTSPHPIVEEVREVLARVGRNILEFRLFEPYQKLVGGPTQALYGPTGSKYFDPANAIYHIDTALEGNLGLKMNKLGQHYIAIVRSVFSAKSEQDLKNAIFAISSISNVEYGALIRAAGGDILGG